MIENTPFMNEKKVYATMTKMTKVAKMAKMVECVPNFSEGRRPEVINAIVDEALAVTGVRVLDCSSDANHNRTVLTFVGEPQAAKRAAFACCARAAELIDMEKHKGEHPRIGATDVIPFIPVTGVDMEECVALAHELGEEIADAYENCEFGKAMRLIMECGNRANKFVEDHAPWVLKKEQKLDALRDVCTIGMNLFRQIVVYLAPVLPELAKQVGELMNAPITGWEDAQKPLLGVKINEYKHLMTRVSQEGIKMIIEESKESTNEPVTASPNNDSDETLKAEPLMTEKISIDDFTKIDLRVARIIEAEEVTEAKKLLRLTLSLGGEERRNVFAGIKSAYDPKDLVGRLVVCVANLEPRQMKFGLSEGMVVAAGLGGKEIFLMSPDEGAKTGMRLH